MATFARVISGTVVELQLVANAVITDDNGHEQEQLGQEFLSELLGGQPQEWVQCSYSASFRGAYPGVGWSYDEVLDEFIAPEVTGA